MGLLSRGMSFLGRVGAENESETVTISRLNVFTNKTCDAVIGGPGFNVDQQIDIPGRIGDWKVDFYIRIADWTASGCTGQPLVNDKIVRVVGGVSKTFRVFADNNVPAWDWGEPEQVTYRIHARFDP